MADSFENITPINSTSALMLKEQRDEAASSGEGNGPKGPTMDARVAKLEAHVENIQRDISDIKVELRSLREEAQSNFKSLLFSGIGAALLVLGVAAKGFHWL